MLIENRMIEGMHTLDDALAGAHSFLQHAVDVRDYAARTGRGEAVPRPVYPAPTPI